MLHDRRYVIGDRTDSLSSNLDSNEMYDAQQGDWTELAPIPSKRGELAALSPSTDNLIFVFGGESSTKTFGNNEAYSPSNDNMDFCSSYMLNACLGPAVARPWTTRYASLAEARSHNLL